MSGRQSFQILYVDPDADRRRQVTEQLDRTYGVTTVETATAACNTVDHDANCLVTAVELPDGSGIELLEAADRLERRFPVVLWVERADEELLRTALRFGAADVIERSNDVSAAVEQLEDRVETLYRESVTDLGTTVLDVSRSLMSAAPDEVDTKIEWGLRSVGRELDATYCAVYRFDDDRFERSHDWRADEEIERPAAVADASAFPGYEAALRGFETYVDPDSDPESVGPAILRGATKGTTAVAENNHQTTLSESRDGFFGETDVESMLAAPVVVDWELDGALVVLRAERAPWPGQMCRELRTLGELIGHTLRRQRQRRELERQNERLERFAGIVSHDLRNPLNVISGYTNLIRETGDVGYVDEIEAATERMERLLDGLLTLARRGEQLGDLELVDLEELVRESWDSVATEAATLEVDELACVEGDPGRLRQVFENLIRNAIEHGRTDSPTVGDPVEHDGNDVTIRVGPLDDRAGFYVEDDGSGIPPEDRDVVFEEGHTGGGGTGLGLAIVKRVIEAHGWTVTVTDSDDGGARFEIVTDQSASAADRSG